MGTTTVKIVAAALLEHGGGVVLLRRARNFEDIGLGRGLWEPPGGAVESGETVADAVRREVQEETRLSLPDDGRRVVILNYTLDAGGRSVQRVHVLHAFTVDDASALATGEEHDAYRVVHDPSELDALDMLQPLREFLRDWLTHRRAS